jgi:hypothetical protein
MARSSAYALVALVLAASCGDKQPSAPPSRHLTKPTAAAAPATTVTISGVVVDHTTGKQVGNVEVVLVGDAGEQTARANATGEWTLRATPGAYRAYVRGDGVLSVGLTERTRLDNLPRRELAGTPDEALMPLLDARADLTGVELGVEPVAELTGEVLGPDDRKLANAVVRLRSLNRFIGLRPVLGTDSAITDDRGQFKLRVPPGSYVLDASHPSYAGVHGGDEFDLRAGAQEDTTVFIDRGCIISGRVVNADGSPANDGAIERLGARGDGFGPAGRIDGGAFRWVTTETETVTLRAWPWRSPPSAARTFSCNEGRRFDNVVLRLPDQRPDLSGVIVDANDKPVPLAYLDVTSIPPFPNNQQERGDAGGNWHVYDMPAGRYRITASAPGKGIVDTVVVGPRQDIRLTLGGTGRIVGTTTELVAGSVEVSFLHCGPKDNAIAVAHEPRIVPVSGGRFTIERAPACTLALAVRWRDKLVETSVVVEPERTAYVEVDVGEPRAKTVSGIVRDVAGNAVEGARVTAVVKDREAETVRTDAAGRFTVKTSSGAQLVAGKGEHVGRATVGRANVATEQVDLVLDDAGF